MQPWFGLWGPRRLLGRLERRDKWHRLGQRVHAAQPVRLGGTLPVLPRAPGERRGAVHGQLPAHGLAGLCAGPREALGVAPHCAR